jgi:hypothetical protein
MDARTLAKGIAAGRLGFGLALIAAPERFTAVWLGRDAGRAGTQVAARGLGARDLAFGAGTLAASDSSLRGWAAAATVGDAADLIATVTAGDDIPLAGRILVGALAAGATALGVAAVAGLGRPPA